MAKTKAESLLLRQRWGERFIHGDYTQRDISELTGMSEKTISAWAIADKWQERKQNRVGSMRVLGEQAMRELMEIDRAIQARPEGERFASSKECDIQIKKMKIMQLAYAGVTYPILIEVCEKILKFVRQNYNTHTDLILDLVDKFQEEEEKRYLQ